MSSPQFGGVLQSLLERQGYQIVFCVCVQSAGRSADLRLVGPFQPCEHRLWAVLKCAFNASPRILSLPFWDRAPFVCGSRDRCTPDGWFFSNARAPWKSLGRWRCSLFFTNARGHGQPSTGRSVGDFVRFPSRVLWFRAAQHSAALSLVQSVRPVQGQSLVR